MPQELFSTCTHVSLHCSLTEGTRGLVDEPMLNRMPSVGADGAACGAHLINMSRGGVVLESAVAAALEAGGLDSYCADVYVSGADRTRRPSGPVFCDPSHERIPARAQAEEPLPSSSALLGHDSFCGTPHIGGATIEAQARVGTQIVEAVLCALGGAEPLDGIVCAPGRRVRRDSYNYY